MRDCAMIAGNAMERSIGGSRTATRFMRIPLGACLAFVGALAAIGGTFLPWAHVTVVSNPIVGRSFSLDPAGWNGDGNVVFGLGVVAAVVGLLLTYHDYGRRGTVLRTLVLLCGLAVVAVTFWDTTHVSSRFSHVAQQIEQQRRLNRVAPRVLTRVDPGIVIAAGGGVLMVFAAVIDRFLFDVEVIEEDED
jgi:hypothetical protein